MAVFMVALTVKGDKWSPLRAGPSTWRRGSRAEAWTIFRVHMRAGACLRTHVHYSRNLRRPAASRPPSAAIVPFAPSKERQAFLKNCVAAAKQTAKNTFMHRIDAASPRVMAEASLIDDLVDAIPDLRYATPLPPPADLGAASPSSSASLNAPPRSSTARRRTLRGSLRPSAARTALPYFKKQLSPATSRTPAPT